MSITGVPLGFLIGAVPSIAMTLSSILLSNIQVSPSVEAIFQNFAGGLILAVVAAELFPLMLEGTVVNSMVGVTIGFIFALCLLNGLEVFIEYLEETIGGDGEEGKSESGDSEHSEIGITHFQSLPSGFETMSENASIRTAELTKGNVKVKSKDSEDAEEKSAKKDKKEGFKSTCFVDWEPESVTVAAKAFESKNHREHILDHMKEMSTAIRMMEERANKLIEDQLTQREAEDVAEKIDEEIHHLEYRLDHTRRLVQGSESEISHDAPIHQSMLTLERKVAMKKRLRNLQLIVEHVIEHISEIHNEKSEGESMVGLTSGLDVSLLREIHAHMDQMEREIKSFHDSVAKVNQRWRRHLHRPLPVVEVGDKLPAGLIVPVTLDCFVDGFMIGIACALSPPAGIILGAANCLEMSFLGMAYSTRITKCTGSTPLARNLALYIPPLIMFLVAGLGALIGVATYEIPIIYIALVAFGTVALLALVCTELLIEARENQGDDEKWYINIFIFVGIYIVLLLARAGI